MSADHIGAIALIVIAALVSLWSLADRSIARAFHGAGVQYGPRIAYGLDEDAETWMPFPSDEFIDRMWDAHNLTADRAEFERQVLADIDRIEEMTA